MYKNPLTLKQEKPRLLFAEDDPDQSEMMTEALQDAGYIVDTAFSGEAAERKLRRNKYDLIVLDVRMPGVDGVTLLRRIRKHEQGARVPVIMASAFATDRDLEHYKEIGADTGFSKPYETSDLVNAVATLLGRAIK